MTHNKQNSKTLSSLRIIAGTWRGRKVTFSNQAIRPTPDRIRETLFNWLRDKIHNATCIDLFAGSGILSYEALSRHASLAIAIEKDKTAYNDLLHNQVKFNTNLITVFNMDALDYLQQSHTFKADIIFLDPPYALNLLPTCFQLLEKSSLLTENTYLYFEHNDKIESIPHKWHIIKAKKAGNVYYYLAVNKAAVNQLSR